NGPFGGGHIVRNGGQWVLYRNDVKTLFLQLKGDLVPTGSVRKCAMDKDHVLDVPGVGLGMTDQGQRHKYHGQGKCYSFQSCFHDALCFYVPICFKGLDQAKYFFNSAAACSNNDLTAGNAAKPFNSPKSWIIPL